MDQGWAEKNRAVEPKDIRTKDENFAHRNANGTGPFMLKSWDPDVKLVLVRNPAWWGKLSAAQRQAIEAAAAKVEQDAIGVTEQTAAAASTSAIRVAARGTSTIHTRS